MASSDEEVLEKLAFWVVIILSLGVIVVGYAVLAWSISALLSVFTTIGIGKGKSVITNFLTLLVVIGLATCIAFILFDDTFFPKYQPITVGCILLVILFWMLKILGWSHTNKIYLTILSWYEARFWPDFTPSFILNKDRRELKATSFQTIKNYLAIKY